MRPERMAFVTLHQAHRRHYNMPLSNECRMNDASTLHPHINNDFNVFSFRPFEGPPSHAVEASSSLFLSSTLSLLSHILSTIVGALSFVLSSIASILLPTAAQLQRAGETLLATFLFLSVIQALVALYQYRYDSRGQLVFPDGLTYGEEDYFAANDARRSDNNIMLGNRNDEKKGRCQGTVICPTGTNSRRSCTHSVREQRYSTVLDVIQAFRSHLLDPSHANSTIFFVQYHG